VACVLAEEPVPLKIVRNYPPYHEIADPREDRAAIVQLRLYGEEALAGREADLWILENTLTLEHAGEPLSAYEVAHDAAGSPDDARGRSGRLAAVRKPTLFETSYVARQMRLFGLAETLGEDGWLKVLRLDDYAPRISRQPEMLQQVLFTYTDAI
jgi:hypothetical protein